MTMTQRRPSRTASPPPVDRLTEYRPGRNFIRLGDVVHVERAPGRRPFDGRVTDIRGHVDDVRGTIVRYVAVIDPHTGNERIVDPADIKRRAQSKVPTR